MTDFDYDVMQKKRIASGDRHRKRGSKSKYCGLPSDHMTQAQWKKRNGEVKVMNLNEPMPWKAFKAMPEDLQKEYVQKVDDRFHCTMSDFARMFQVQPVTVNRQFQSLCVSGLFPKGKRMSTEQKQAFAVWSSAKKTDPVPVTPEQANTPAQQVKRPSALASSSRMDMAWEGDADLVSVLELVHQFANGQPITLRVIAEKEAIHEPV